MAKQRPARTPAPEPKRSASVERLTDAVNRLADELRVVRDVLDDVREDLNWVTRNSIPGRAIQHTRVIRMARDPLAADAREHLELRTYTLEPKNCSGISPEVFDELVSEIAEAMTVVGQEQLNMFLTALDDARAKLIAAIRQPVAAAVNDKPVAEPQAAKLGSTADNRFATVSSKSVAPATPEPVDPLPNQPVTPAQPTKRGHLF